MHTLCTRTHRWCMNGWEERCRNGVYGEHEKRAPEKYVDAMLWWGVVFTDFIYCHRRCHSHHHRCHHQRCACAFCTLVYQYNNSNNNKVSCSHNIFTFNMGHRISQPSRLYRILQITLLFSPRAIHGKRMRVSARDREGIGSYSH